MNRLNGRERLLAALNHKEADRVPLDLGTTNSTGISVAAYRNYLRLLGKKRDVITANTMQQLARVD